MVMVKRYLRSLVWCGLAFSLLCPVLVQESQAALVTYSFEGNVGDIQGSANPFSPGQTMSGLFTYDTSTTPSFLDPVNGQYSEAITHLSLFVGSYSVTSATGAINILNNNGLLGDSFTISSAVTGLPLNGSTPVTFNLGLQDFSGLALDSPALGPLPPSSAFGSTLFSLSFTDDPPFPQIPNRFSITGQLTSLTPVPLPAAAVLFPTGLSLLAIAFRRLKTRESNDIL